MDKISIIIPFYNMEQYIENCLNSAVKQTLSPKEIICINDGSTDRSTEIVKQFQEVYPYISLFNQNRKGSGSARNLGIRQARGEFVAFLDADDFYMADDVLEILYNGAKNNDVDAAAGRFIGLKDGNYVRSGWMGIDETGFSEEQVVDYDQYQGVGGYQAYIFSKEMIIENDIFFPDYPRFQDPIFLQKALVKAQRIWTTPREIYAYRRIDKKIDYSGSDVVYGIVSGLYDMAGVAYENGYYKCLSNLKTMLYKLKIYFAIHVVNGNDMILDILQRIDQFYGDNDRSDNAYYLDWSLEKYTQYIKGYELRFKNLIEKVRQYEGVIIYGAGEEGKTLYDALSAIDGVDIFGFAVTKTGNESTSRGLSVKCIDEYLDKKENTLLIIAAKQIYIEEMMATASEKGFKNVMCITEQMVNVSDYIITNNVFAVK